MGAFAGAVLNNVFSVDSNRTLLKSIKKGWDHAKEIRTTSIALHKSI